MDNRSKENNGYKIVLVSYFQFFGPLQVMDLLQTLY